MGITQYSILAKKLNAVNEFERTPVPNNALEEAQESGDVLGAHRILMDAFETDVRPHCWQK